MSQDRFKGGEPMVVGELPLDFKTKMLAFYRLAPDSESEVEKYLNEGKIQQLLGYLTGFNEEWAGIYMAQHPEMGVDEMESLLSEARALLAELRHLSVGTGETKRDVNMFD